MSVRQALICVGRDRSVWTSMVGISAWTTTAARTPTPRSQRSEPFLKTTYNWIWVIFWHFSVFNTLFHYFFSFCPVVVYVQWWSQSVVTCLSPLCIDIWASPLNAQFPQTSSRSRLPASILEPTTPSAFVLETKMENSTYGLVRDAMPFRHQFHNLSYIMCELEWKKTSLFLFFLLYYITVQKFGVGKMFEYFWKKSLLLHIP